MPPEQQHNSFRQRLDAVLRERNPDQLRTFLISEGQWQPEQQTDTEAAMWMMIAASSALKGMHAEAEHWLLTHGHEAEAGAILGSRRERSADATKRQSTPERPREHSRGSSPSRRGAPDARRASGGKSGGAGQRRAANRPREPRREPGQGPRRAR